jgi:hypothetical protein
LNLVKVFNKANNQTNSLVEQNVSAEKGKSKFYYKIIAGVSSFMSNYDYNNVYKLKPSEVTFTNPIIGVEFSNVFGINSKRSELFGRLIYQNAKTESNYYSSANTSYNVEYTLNSKFSSINLSAGYRYAFVKTGKSKITVDGSIGVTSLLNGDIKIDYVLTYTGANPNPAVSEEYLLDKFSTNIFFNIGAGYVFDDKYGVNIEYSLPKNYLSKYVDLSGGYSNFNLIFTYTLN